MRSSTGLPALTMIITRRGVFSELTSSCSVFVPTIFFPRARPSRKVTTLS